MSPDRPLATDNLTSSVDVEPRTSFLEDELFDALRRTGLTERQAQAVAMRLGWDGQGGVTLEAAGAEAGVTRERIRQLASRVKDRLAQRTNELPLLAIAVAELERIAPVRRETAGGHFAACGLTRRSFDPAGVLEAARLVGISTDLSVTSSFVLGAADRASVTKVEEVCRKLVSRNGAGQVDAVVDALELHGSGDLLVRLVLEGRDDITWLDADHQWFFIPTPRNRAINYVKKMLSVSPSLTTSELRDGLRRAGGERSVFLPRDIIRALCDGLDWTCVDGHVVRRNIDLDYRDVLENTEETLVDVFTQNGPVLDRQSAVDLAQQYGLDRTTAGLYLGWSPVIERLMLNRYALRGADIPIGTLEAMRGRDRRTSVQRGHGWTAAGRLWIGYMLSQAALDSNVVGVPGALRDELRGKYTIQPVDAHLGELNTDGQNLWGLARLLRRTGAEAGDALVLEFDLTSKECHAFVGGAELLDPENRGIVDPPASYERRGENSNRTVDEELIDGDHPVLGTDESDGAVDREPIPLNDMTSMAVEPTAQDEYREDITGRDNASDGVSGDLLAQVGADEDLMAHTPDMSLGTAQGEPCVVPGCANPGKNKLGVRCRVWQEPSPIEGKHKTSALWAPDTDAFLCDEHALEGRPSRSCSRLTTQGKRRSA